VRNAKTLRRLLGFLKPYRWRVALAISLGVVTVVSNVGLLATAAYVISGAAVVAYLFELTFPIYAVRLFSVSRSFSRYGERLFSHDATFRLLANLRAWFYGRLEPLAPARLTGYRGGDLLSRIVRDVEELENVYLRVFSPLVVAAAVSALAFALLYAFSGPALALATLASLAAAGIGVPLLTRGLSRGLARRRLELQAALSADVVDGVQGIQDLLAFGAEAERRKEMYSLGRKLRAVQNRLALATGFQNALGDLITNLAMISALVLAIPLVASGEVEGVYLAFLVLVVLGAFEAVAPLGGALQALGKSVAAADRLFEVADSEPGVTDPDEPSPPPRDFTLEFDRVGLRYEPGAPLALDDVSLTLRPGSRVAVVGPSGSGKSSLASLAMRFWDPTEGEVRLGGRDARGYAQQDLRAAVGLVAQSAHVFNDTLRANLLVADPGADDAALAEALEGARLSGLPGRLPGGLDGYLGEGGLKLSGGERQRLAVARALLKDAPVLILDEPTANLDPITERELLASVGELTRGRSTLVITHRLVGMEEMDEIVVLDRGRVVQRGPHEELRRADGPYSRMLEVQDRMLETGRPVRAKIDADCSG
jgi:ATP-binding cassette, subfamily C, bacterial CydC